MNPTVSSLLPTIVILGIAAMLALFLMLTSRWTDQFGNHIRSTIYVVIITIIFQAAHFSEELLTGLDKRLPDFFGLAPMSTQFFITFNLFWLFIWAVSTWGLAKQVRLALFPIWFLAIGSIINGVGHPLLAALTAGYFPGLITAPLMGIMGLLLVKRLQLITTRTE